MDAIALLEHDVRERVRHSGIDPVSDPQAIRGLITDALRDYDRQVLRGYAPALPDAERTAKELLDTVAGFGPLQRHLDDPEVEEIWINSPTQVFVARQGVAELTNTVLTQDDVARLVEQMLKSTGRRLDLSTPFVDAMLPDGSRLHVVIPDITRSNMAVNIRKFIARATHLSDLVARGMLPTNAATFLDACVRAGLNIVVAGATGAGKTTFLRALTGSVSPLERIVTVEEVFELNLTHRDVVAMQCRGANLEGTGEINLRRLVKESLRMRPDRVIVGEVREAESLDLLLALNSGMPGMATLHANSAREAVTKLTTLPLLAGENVTAQFVVPTVAQAIDIVVHIQRDRTGYRRVNEIAALSGRIEQDAIEVGLMYHTVGDTLTRGDAYPPKAEQFQRAGIDVSALLNGRDTWV